MNTEKTLRITPLIKFWIILVCLIGALPSMADNLTASVDRDTLGLEEAFVLNLRYDKQINATPDYELLRKDFDILNVQSGTQMSIINGSMEASTQWNISLAPKKIGKALIPSFNIDGAVSDAIEITIEGKSNNPNLGNNDITVVTEISHDSTHVQQQLLLTVRLYSTVSLNGAELQPLELKNAIVVKLDDKQYQTQIRGKTGLVLESRFIIYPQESGELNIPSLLYQAAIDNGTRDIFGRGNSKVLRYRTDEVNVQVDPAISAAGEPWLPAKGLTLSEHWNMDLDNLKVGEPVSRSITIKAEGLTAAQIPPLDSPQINHLTFYKDQAQSEDQKSDKSITGSRIETMAIVPTQPGKYVLPEVKVKWWNTDTQQFEVASLAAVTLTVASGAMSTNNLQATGAIDATEPMEPLPLNTDLNSLPTTAPQIIKEAPLWLYVSNLLSLIGLAWFGRKVWQLQKKLNAIHHTNEQLKTQQTHTEAQAWQKLKHSLVEHNALKIRTDLLNWAQIHWHNPQLINLQCLGSYIGDSNFNNLLHQLDQTIYSNNVQALNTSELLQLLSNLRRDKTKKATTQNELQPLYKS